MSSQLLQADEPQTALASSESKLPRFTRRPRFVDYLCLLIGQNFSRQTLERIPEPEAVTDRAQNVLQYNQVMSTKLAVAYACGLMVLHRAGVKEGGTAIDLACGPGHFTLCLARYLKLASVVGVDLSPRMVEIATRNAEQQGLANQVRFCIGDVTKLGEIAGGGFDLACFTDAAHHIPDLETVSRVLGAMDRITRPDGLVMAMDLVRLKSRALTEHYVNVLGHDYVDRGLPDFLEDFRNSMYAAWNTEELRTAIPGDTGRQWVQVVPRGLPTVQVVLGLPTGRKRVFVRRGVPWKQTDYVILPQLRSSWRIMRLLLGVAAIRCI